MSKNSKLSQLEKHPRYWQGQEHMFYLRALYKILTQVDRIYANETDRRKAWFADRKHYYPELMLIGVFAYLEGELKSGWIDKFGTTMKRELYTLRLIRNSFVHKAGDVSKLNRYKKKNIDARKGRPPNIQAFVRRFISDLENGKIIDVEGTVVPPYISMTRGGEVKLADNAFKRIYQLAIDVLDNSGRFPEINKSS